MPAAISEAEIERCAAQVRASGGCYHSAAKVLGVGVHCLRKRMERAGQKFARVKETGDACKISASDSAATLDDVLRDAGVDRDTWEVDRHRTSCREQLRKGERHKLWSHSVTLRKRRDAFDLRVPSTQVAQVTVETGVEDTALILPDSQHGFRRVGDELIPTHDPRACAIAVEVARREQPDVIFLMGDMLDFAGVSVKYAREPELQFVLQQSLVALHAWLVELRKACPAARIVYIEGNHEKRLADYLITLAPEVHGLCRVGEDAPVLSVPYLLRLDELGVEYVGPYGEGVWWYGVYLHHGTVVGQGGGATVAKMLRTAGHSQVVGHIHRQELARRKVHDQDGGDVIFALCAGCLCDVEGKVPPGGSPDWQQGFALLRVAGGRMWDSLGSIVGGVCLWRGEVLEA